MSAYGADGLSSSFRQFRREGAPSMQVPMNPRSLVFALALAALAIVGGCSGAEADPPAADAGAAGTPTAGSAGTGGTGGAVAASGAAVGGGGQPPSAAGGG